MGDVRGKGLLLGVEIIDPASSKRSAELAKYVQKYCVGNGLILELGGRDNAVVRMLPPLNVSEQTVSAALSIVADAFESIAVELAIDSAAFHSSDYVI